MQEMLQNVSRVTLPLMNCEDAALLALGASFGLSFSFRELFLIRDHYRRREHRDPTVWELRLLESILRATRALPQNTLLSNIEGNEADRRVFADLQKKANLLGQTASALSITEIAALTDRFAAHCGLSPREPELYATDAASAAIRQPDAPPALIKDAHAALFARRHAPKKAKHAQNLLLLLRNDGSEAFAGKVTRFLQAAAPYDVHPVAHIGAEGLLADLPLLHGLTLDLAPINAEIDAALDACAAFGVGDVLLKAPEHRLHEIVALGAPLCAIGRITADERISAFHGRRLLFSFSASLLSLLGQTRTLTPTVTHLPAQRFDECTAAGLYGITVGGDCLTTLCEWLCRAVAGGADLHRASLCTLLTLPDCSEQAIADALTPLLAFHRLASELSLAVAASDIRLCPGEAARLSVFLSAKVEATAAKPSEAELQAALTAGDFAALRVLLRK